MAALQPNKDPYPASFFAPTSAFAAISASSYSTSAIYLTILAPKYLRWPNIICKLLS